MDLFDLLGFAKLGSKEDELIRLRTETVGGFSSRPKQPSASIEVAV